VSVPTRIDEDLFAAAREAAARNSRSAAKQINHWARLGRELEASADLRFPAPEMSSAAPRSPRSGLYASGDPISERVDELLAEGFGGQ
jgi:hypothetical protein